MDQPNHIDTYEKSKKSDECFLITEFFSRRAAYPVARLAVRLGLSANAVSIIGGLLWLLSIPSILFAAWCFTLGYDSGCWGWLIASAVLWNVGYILDVADGSVARMTGTSSPAGFFLDFSFHLVFNPMYLCSIGAFLFIVTGTHIYLLLGILSICANWAPAIEAREHVLCNMIASRKLQIDDLADEQQFEVFTASTRVDQSARSKTHGLRMLSSLAVESVCFPGQFMLFGAAVAVDAVVAYATGAFLPVLRLLFIAVSCLLVARIPFTIRREFLKLKRLDEWN